MRTIEKILSKVNSSVDRVQRECNRCKCCNGCGGKGGINFSKLMMKLPYFDEGKGKQLYNDLYIWCCWHDLQFNKGGNVLDFLKVNYIFSVGIFELLNWTNICIRYLLSLIILLLLNVFGIKYFSWGK